MKNFGFFLLSIFAAAILLTACGNASQSPYQRVSESTLQPGAPIPAPTGEVILTISGKIGVTNNGDQLLLDMETLEKFGLVQYELNDPWLKEKFTYTGVLMSDLLKFIQSAPEAESVHLIALDDYEVDIVVRDIEKWPILLATRANGQYMSVAENGPTRIIFPFDQFPEIDQTTYRDLMIWNIASMEVR